MIPKKDLVILSHLRSNARMGLTQMSRSSRVPVSTIHDRIKQFGQSYVHRSTALLNFAALGFGTRVSLLLRVHSKDKDALREHLARSPSVNSLFKINNGFDYFADCVFRSMRDLEDFVDGIERQYDIKAKQVHFIIDDIKRESFLSDPQLIEIFIQGTAS